VERRLPVTVTDPGMRRYFMVTSEAVQLVLQASVAGVTGDVLVLDMGKPVGIVDLARDVIRFYGYEPDVDIPIVYTGFRPGEKLAEDLFTESEERDATAHERVFIARLQRPAEGWSDGVDRLVGIAEAGEDGAVFESLRDLVPDFQSPESDAVS